MAANAEGFDRPYEFRAMNVEAAPTNANSTINHIEADKWYQLRTSFSRYGDDFRPQNRRHRSDNGVLVQYRDLKTGNVYLRVEDERDAPLVNSLWRIEYTKDDGVGGGKYRFINKETNVALMFDQTFANSSDAMSWFSSLMVNGCVNEWEWYNNNKQTSKFGEVAPYAYFADQENVMVMRVERNGFVSAYKGRAADMLDDHGVANIPHVLKFQPVVASVIELGASDFNSMIDYNKPSWDQEGEFAFYEPNGDLFNQIKMSPEIKDAMAAGMRYQAEDGGDALEDFFALSVRQEGGTASASDYRTLMRAARNAKNAADAAVRKANRLSYALSVAEGNTSSAKAAADGQKAIVDGLESNFKAAYDIAIEIAKATKNAHTTEVYKAKFTGLPLRLNDYAEHSNEYSKYNELYTAALNAYESAAINSPEKVYAALDLFNAESELLANGWKAKNYLTAGLFLDLKSAFADYDDAYTSTERGYVNEYAAEYNEYKALDKAYNEAVSAENDARIAYAAAADEADQKETAWQTAQANFETATAAFARTRYLLTNNFLRLEYMSGNTAGTYLMADTTFWQTAQNPSSNQIVLANKTPKATDSEAIAARYYHRLIYNPTQDSLVVEPLNASKISDADYKAGKNWADTYVGTNFVYSDDVVTKASQASNTWTNTAGDEIAVKLEYLNSSKWCLTAAEVNSVADSPLKTRIAFNNPYGYLTRTTLAEGLYFIKSTNRGRYLVDNFNGNLMYDVSEKGIQDYNQMPATMWVVEKLGCEGGDLVVVRNREYGKDWNPIFAGQLYVDENGNLFTINNWYGKKYNSLSAELMLANNQMYLTDNYEFIPVTDETALTSNHHGYGFMDPETLKYTNYAFRYNHNNGDKYLNIDADNLLKVTTDANVYYELDTVYPYDINEFENLSINNFGYGAGVVNVKTGDKLPQLQRQRYTLKVKDVNLIDNDTTYVAMNTTLGANGYYIAKGIKEIRKGGAILSSFYLKNDQIDDTETCYALIDTRSNYANDYEWNGYRRATVIDGNAHVEYNSLNNYPNSAVSAFALEVNNRPLYRSIPETGVNFFRTVGGVDQKLFHDATNESHASAVIDGFGYLGLAQEKMAANDDDKEL
ncbi:MAG: hypothetical protein LUG65_01395, partial [Clostridiales bacterium]|nr:hypothetical protein [Clostridiales bacterium]